MIARAVTFWLSGLVAHRLDVEAHLHRGVPSFVVVGLADRAVQEARERVRSGIGSAEYEKAAAARGDRYGRSGWREPQRSEGGGRIYGTGAPRREAVQPPASSYSAGDIVEHKTFGRGTVAEIKGDKLVIDFGGVTGTKTLLAGFAPLRKLDV